MSFNYTLNQSRAITARGSALLVSAAAGSGKTRVLTERVMSYVLDPENPENIDRFLIITYTRAAAAEMRSRIMDSLGKAAAESPADRRLRRQQDLCYHAQIGTIHSFCTTVLRENCHHLGLPPTFKVLDEDRASQMKAAVLERLLEARYERMASHPGFRTLADTVGAGRDDRRLTEAVLKLYEKIRSHPYPNDWAAEQMAALDRLDNLSDAADTVWGREILSDIRRSAEYWAGRMEEATEAIYAADEKIIRAYGPVFAEDAAALRDFVRALDSGWDKARDFLPPEKFARLGTLTKYDNVELKDRVKAVRDGYKKAAEVFRKALAESSSQQIADLRAMAPAMKAMLDLAMDFDRSFAAEKKREGLLDFSDLEHLCLELLVDKATGKATWIAVELSQRYREIMVDEYQDVNRVQDMIFRAVSREGTNLFMVGDVKQSIYRFRLADPSIFLEKYHSYADFEADSTEPRRIMLQENFRSRKSVLDAANLVFSNIMSAELGELDYDADAALRFGAPDYPEGTDSPVELCLIDPSGLDDEESPEKSRLEARFVAERIKSMMLEHTPVYERGTVRDCRWSDFAVLMRSPGGKGSIFHAELAAAGIPVQSANAGGFFTSLEVAVTIDMLAIIDNPHADVPLISVLRSPAFGFSPDELTAIRCADKSADFYTALLTAAEKGSSRCRGFVDMLSSLRAIAPDLSLDALIWRIYSDTELFALCSAMADGDARRDNLMRLFELARSFEETGYRGVFRFVSWLRRMAERGQEPAAAAKSDAVSIMSIHKSKGLEFPFVFLCDTHHRFNRSDSREAVLCHAQLGLGPKLTDTARGIEYPTMARRAIERRIETETLSEEMRVLYVAMTRARERLVMTACWPKAENGLKKLGENLTSPMHPALLRAAPAFSHWLSAAALIGGGELIKLSIIDSADIGQSEAPEAQAVEKAEADEALMKLLAENLSYRYPHAHCVEMPTKITATELKGSFGDSVRDEESAPLVESEPEFDFRRPDLAAMGKLSATQRGTATHTFMQYVDFAKTADRAGLKAELERITAAGHLSPEEAAAVDISRAERFFESALGQRLRKSEKLYREFRFTLLVDAPKAGGEELLLQGIVDCLMIEPDGITIIDYKTDRVSAEAVPQRAQRYAGQINAYAEAAGRIFSLPVKQRILHFLVPGVSFEAAKA